jgi:hypothetical protein
VEQLFNPGRTVQGLADLALWVREAIPAREPDLTERVYCGWEADA